MIFNVDLVSTTALIKLSTQLTIASPRCGWATWGCGDHDVIFLLSFKAGCWFDFGYYLNFVAYRAFPEERVYLPVLSTNLERPSGSCIHYIHYRDVVVLSILCSESHMSWLYRTSRSG